MTRLNIVLLIALLASSVWLVRVSYDSRRLYSELDRQTSLASELSLENERLQVERREQATPGRTKRIARERLGMNEATAGTIVLVPTPEGAAAPFTAPAPSLDAGAPR